MYSSILVANDGSTLGRKAFRHGLELASHLKARLSVVVAIEPVLVLFGAGKLASTITTRRNRSCEREARRRDWCSTTVHGWRPRMA